MHVKHIAIKTIEKRWALNRTSRPEKAYPLQNNVRSNAINIFLHFSVLNNIPQASPTRNTIVHRATLAPAIFPNDKNGIRKT